MRPSARLALGALCATAARGQSQWPIPDDDETKSVRGSPFTKEFGEHVGELLKKWHVPGVAVGIVDGDDIWTEVRRWAHYLLQDGAWQRLWKLNVK